jgi:hypothetical protein
LLARFDGRVWAAPARQAEEYSDGLTLQATAFLLRAEDEGAAELPPALLDRVPALLDDCGARPLAHPVSAALFSEPFTNPQGKRVPRPNRPVRLLWHPWAVDCAARWLRRCERRGAPGEEVVRARRALGHLVLTLGDAAVADARTGYTYVAAETLVGLGAVDGP